MKTTNLAIKQWGGGGIALGLEDDAGGYSVEFDCAHGTIQAPIKVDCAGQFEARGTFTQERPGPIRADDPNRERPARYVGKITGGTMTLTITIEGGKEKLGPYTLQANAQGRIVKCL